MIKNEKYKIENIKNKVLCGDVISELKRIPDESIDTVITSPPYFGLRSYDSLYDKEFSNKEKAKKWILKKEKENKDYFSKIREIKNVKNKTIGYKAIIYSKFIKKNQVGLEETPKDYINRMVEIAKEVKRVLKKTGSFWLNIGDSYNTKSGSGMIYGNLPNQKEDEYGVSEHRHTKRGGGNYPTKCLLQIPQRIAIALTDKVGFTLRNDIIWSKQVLIHKKNSTIGNVMPSSVKDRLNNSYEHLFFFTKNKKYYFDLNSIRIPHQTGSLERYQRAVNLGAIQVQGKMFEDKVDKPMQPPKVFREKFGKDKNYKGKFNGIGKESENFGSPRARNERSSRLKDSKNIVDLPQSSHQGKTNAENLGSYRDFKIRKRVPRGGLVPDNTSQARLEHDVRNLKNEVDNNIQGKNLCDVWQVNTQPSSIKHFALFPVALLSRPIKTCLPNKICKKCGHIVTTISEKEGTSIYSEQGKPEGIERSEMKWGKSHPNYNPRWWSSDKVIGENICKCKNPEYEGGIVLDPFFGGGTTAIAQRLYKPLASFIGIEINKSYIEIAEKRIKEESPDGLGI